MSPTPQSASDVPQKSKKCEPKTLESYRDGKKTVHREGFFEKYSYVRVLLFIDGGAAKKLDHTTSRELKKNLTTAVYTGKNKSDHRKTHFLTSATKARCLEDLSISFSNAPNACQGEKRQ